MTGSGDNVETSLYVVQLLALLRLRLCACFKSHHDQALHTCVCHSVLATTISWQFFVSNADGAFITQGGRGAGGEVSKVSAAIAQSGFIACAQHTV